MTSEISDSMSLTVDEFWRWLHNHMRCISRAGTAGACLIDNDSLHWTLGEEHGPDGERLCCVQLCQGKDVVSELSFRPADITYVRVHEDDGEWLFDFFGKACGPVCGFVMMHPYLPGSHWHRGEGQTDRN